MARRGKFGRTPSAAPNLTATIVAIAREMQARRDQNIVDAWKNGGVFEGKPVTDEKLLSYWKGRLDGLDKSDPLYDTYKNSYMQFDYSIAESKISTWYAKIIKPSAADDRRVAQFYLNWAKKVPVDSEFYRALQRDAAQFMRSAASRAAAGSARASAEGYKTRMAATEKSMELPGQTALQVLTYLGQRGAAGAGAVLGSTPIGDPSHILSDTNIDQLQLPGVDDMIALLGKVQNTKEVLYHDNAGNAVTGAAIIARFKAMDPSFDGNFNLAYINKLLDRQRQGILQRIHIAQTTGHASDANNLQTHLAKVNELGQEIQAFPVLDTYGILKQQLDHVMRDNSLMPAAKLAAIDRIRSQIGHLASDKSIATDDHLRSQLIGEANGTAGTVTVSEDMQGFVTGGLTNQTPGNSEVANMNAIHQQLADTVALTSDPRSGYVMTQGDYVSDGQGGTKFLPSPGGRAYGAAPIADVNNMAGPAGPSQQVMVPNGDGKGSTLVTMVPAAVSAFARGPDGQTLSATNSNPVASVLRYQMNGKDVFVYGLRDAATGQVRWTTDAPWAPTVRTVETDSGLALDLTNAIQGAKIGDPTSGDAGTGLFHPLKTDGTVDTTKVVIDPAAAALGTDPVRQKAGPDPNTDSFSPTLAAIQSSPESAALLMQYSNDPNFSRLLDADAHRAAGQTFDPQTGAWSAPSATQQTAYSHYAAVAQTTLSTANDMGRVRLNADQWWRDTTKTETSGASPAVGTGVRLGPPTPEYAQRGLSPVRGVLPLDALRAQQDTYFHALYNAVLPGSNIIAPPSASPTTPAIKPGTAITVPSVTPTPLTQPAKSTTTPAPTTTVQPVAPAPVLPGDALSEGTGIRAVPLTAPSGMPTHAPGRGPLIY